MTNVIYKDKGVYDSLIKNAYYALSSLSRDLVYEVYGMAQMAAVLGAISKDQFYQLNKMLVVEGINNYRNCKLQ